MLEMFVQFTIPEQEVYFRNLDFGDAAIVEAVLDYRTSELGLFIETELGLQYWKPNWDYPLKQGQRKRCKMNLPGRYGDFIALFRPPCFDRKSESIPIRCQSESIPNQLGFQ